MFILNPDKYSLPTYRIGPFRTSDIGTNHLMPESNLIDAYLSNRFNGRKYEFTINGRSAIHTALKYYNLNSQDVVTVLTTTQNFYISSCVTNEIEKFCKWSRKIEDKTKVLFVNHEFGYPYKQLYDLKKYNLPIIEDCCTTFFSNDGYTPIGQVGDFVIFSFPKFFPIQIGGLILTNIENYKIKYTLDPLVKQYIKNVVSYYLIDSNGLIQKRLEVYDKLKNAMKKLNLSERFPLEKGVLPSVFMFKNSNVEISLPALKEHLYAHGIQCSVFYGEDSFFIPAHQHLCESDLDYFIEVIKTFYKYN